MMSIKEIENFAKETDELIYEHDILTMINIEKKTRVILNKCSYGFYSKLREIQIQHISENLDERLKMIFLNIRKLEKTIYSPEILEEFVKNWDINDSEKIEYYKVLFKLGKKALERKHKNLLKYFEKNGRYSSLYSEKEKEIIIKNKNDLKFLVEKLKNRKIGSIRNCISRLKKEGLLTK